MGVYNTNDNIYQTNLTKNDLFNFERPNGQLPYGEYNALGELVGYSWYYGDTINLTIAIDGAITVNNSDIIYTAIGDAPTTSTVGFIGQKAYNVIDLISWECIVATSDNYTWRQDPVFTYPLNGGKTVYITADEYLKGKVARVTIYNFRYEKVYEKDLEASNRINLLIDEELSKEFIRGTYYLTLQVSDESSLLYVQVLKDKDCTITVR